MRLGLLLVLPLLAPHLHLPQQLTALVAELGACVGLHPVLQQQLL